MNKYKIVWIKPGYQYSSKKTEILAASFKIHNRTATFYTADGKIKDAYCQVYSVERIEI